MVTRGYVQAGAAIVVPTAILALLLVFGIEPQSELDGFTLRPGVLDALRAYLLVHHRAGGAAHGGGLC